MIKHYYPMKHKFLSTKFPIFLVLGLLFMGNLSSAQSARTQVNNGQASFPWSNGDGTKEEILSKRNQFSKHFLQADGSVKMYSSPGSIHYKNNSGWQDIKTEIKANHSGLFNDQPYYNADNSFKTFYPQDPVNGKIITTLKQGQMSEHLESMYAVDQNGQVVYQFQASPSPQVKVEASSITYSNMFANIDLRYAQLSDGRKFDVILTNQQALNSLPVAAEFIVLKEKLTLPAAWIIKETANGIDIFEGNTWLANFPVPIAYETESISKNYDSNDDGSYTGNMSMSKNGNEITLYTRFSVSWLKNANRVYPVMLDPVVVYNPFNLVMATGFMTNVPGYTTPVAPKASGPTRITAGGSVGWGKYDISTLPAGAAINAAKYYGWFYSGIVTAGLPFKYAYIVGMQTVDPVTADSISIYNKISNTGPIYNGNFLFGKDTINIWRIGVLSGSAQTDIADQQVQGWTALGFRLATGYLNAQLHGGYNATTPNFKSYLELDYTTTACASAPVPGNATASVTSACALPFSLNLSGNVIATGLTYQWQSSPAGMNTWTNLGPLLNAPGYNTVQTAATDYQCIVTCTGAALTATSAPISVTQSTASACYCVPGGSGTTTSTYYISGFSTTLASPNITNTGTTYSAGGYGNYTSMTAAAVPGNSFNITVTFLGGSQFVGVWIDWNQDGDFNDASENPVLLVTASTAGTLTQSITVPLSAVPGNTRIRVRNVSTGIALNCGAFANSETEDYTINVIGACTSAGTATLVANGDTICPLTTKTMVATVSPFQLGISYQWMSSTTSGGPYTPIAGATGTSYTTPPLAAGTYYYVITTTCSGCGPCSITSNQHAILSQDVVAPTGYNSAQCAPGIPTAYVTSNNPVIGTGNFNWYATNIATTPLQSKPFGPLVQSYFNDFSSSTLTNAQIQSTASITGGVLQMHTPATASATGAFQVNQAGYNSDKYQVDFDFTTVGTPTNMADGFSYSFSDNGLMVDASMNAENGTGGRLKLCFVAYPSATSPVGIYLFYANTTNEAAPSATLGGVGYSSDVSWRNTSNHATLKIDSLGKVTVILNGNTIFNNLSLPAAYLTANKSTWKHIWRARSGAGTILMSTSIDNLEIKQSNLITGWPTYLSSVATTTTFYVAELGSNGCLSPRTPVTVTVNTPPTLGITATPNDSVCTGAPVTLTGTGASTYLWNGSPTSVNGDTTFTSAIAGTYTVTGTDANGCSNTTSVLIYLHPVLSGTASASPGSLCIGNTVNLTASATPICTGLYTNNFIDHYAPSLWTLVNASTNGTVNAAGAPANVIINGGTAGSPSGGITTYYRVVTCPGTVTLNWSFYHPTNGYDDIPQYSINNGSLQTMPSYNTGNFMGTQTGTLSIPVIAGDTIKFHVETIDNDNQAGVLTISGFSAPSAKIDGLISFYDAPSSGTNLGTPPLTVTPTTSGTVTYYAEFTSSTTGCPNLNREPASVNVIPVATATVSGGDTICAGSPLPNLNINLTGTGPWNFTYSDGTTSTPVTGNMTNPYIISNASPGNYSVLTVSDSLCGNGTTSGSTLVAINALPTATVSGGGSVCTGTPLPDVSIALTGVAPWSMTYTDGTTPVSLTGLTASTYTIAGAVGVYSVTMVSDSNCVGTSSGSSSVILNPLPTVTATMTPDTVCSSSTAVATGGGASTYVWNNGITDDLAFIATNTTTYTVTGTDANNCSATSSVTLTVNPANTTLSQATLGNLASTTGSQNNSNVQPDGTIVTYSDLSCDIMATVADLPGGNALGNTMISVTVEASVLTWPVVGGQPYTRRWFTITPTNNTGVNANVTLYLTQADFDDYNLSNGTYPDLPVDSNDAAGIDNIRISKVSGGPLGVGTGTVIIPSSVIWNSANHYWEITFNVSGTFSQFYFHGANPLGSALPVDIISFTGTKEGNQDVLQWTTSSEQNNASFNLEHSADGIHFVTIDKLSTKAVNGNSSTPLIYTSVHAKPVIGHNYYRLEQVDIDGQKMTHSKIVDLIWASNGNTVNIYPNPAKDLLNIDLYCKNATNNLLKIMDMSGRIVKQVQTKTLSGLNHLVVNLNELSSGIYSIQIFENGQLNFVESLRKD